MSPWRVHKFGGSSLADSERIERVAEIVYSEPPGPLAVVLSACAGVTDQLLETVRLAERQENFSDAVAAIERRHLDIAGKLCDPQTAAAYAQEVGHDCDDIRKIFHAVHLTRSAAPAVRDLIVGFGEIWSSKLFAQYLTRRGGR